MKSILLGACLQLVLFAVVYSKSNIILLLTDDQDLNLDGMHPLQATQEFMNTRGAQLTNFFVNTPVCCPSRTTLLTGMYPHNWHTVQGGCMHMDVVNPTFVKDSLGVQMKSLGYTTGQFGKLLNPPGVAPYCNKDDEKRQPLPGFDQYLTMCNDNKYFKNEFATPEKVFTSGTDPTDYLTSLIGNATLEFIENSLKSNETFFAYVAPHAPHVPATPAPWYADNFKNMKAPRTPNWNYSALDHHYVIRSQQPISAEVENKSDTLFQDRWRSLLSVDDIMTGIIQMLDKYNATEDTYIVLTSDHGFNLGQLRLPSCKLQPYEHDIRIPFFIYGPGIRQASKFDIVSGMVDLAPTLLSLGGGTPPDNMDGKSFADIVVQKESVEDVKWRDRHMLEYWSLGNVVRLEHYIDMPNSTYIAARLLNSTHNYLYAEFYDGENVVDFDTPLEYEMFDINEDPYQMTNLYGTNKEDKMLVKELKDFIHSQISCKGKQCV